MNDTFWMAKAYDLAIQAREQQEVPVGAILVDKQNRCIGIGWNQVLRYQDPTAHAEMLAIRNAAQAINNYRLEDTTLYVTLEPCCMCAGAIVHARIKRLVFATRDFKAGAAGSTCNLLKGCPLNHRVNIDEGIMQHACSILLSDFFKLKREF